MRRAYTHAAEYWPERRKMMQVWADQLEAWRDGAKVIPEQLRTWTRLGAPQFHLAQSPLPFAAFNACVRWESGCLDHRMTSMGPNEATAQSRTESSANSSTTR